MATNQKASVSIHTSTSSVSSSSYASRSSTPPTEVSSALSSPTFAPPVETEESIRRRQQSDQASSEIGKRLLKGWAMLSEECPGSRCYAIPLVRPPSTGGTKDARKVCVICNTTYVTEVDAAGWERLVPLDSASQVTSDASRSSSNATAIAGARSGLPQQVVPPLAEPPAPASAVFAATLTDVPRNSMLPLESTVLATTTPLPAATPTNTQPLDGAACSLQNALHVLSTRLNNLTSNPSVFDAVAIGSTADSIGRVSAALSEVRKLQYSEIRAGCT